MQNSGEFSGLPLSSSAKGYPPAQEYVVEGQASILQLQKVVNELGGGNIRTGHTGQTHLFQEIPETGNSGGIQGTVDQLFIPQSWNNLVIGSGAAPPEFTSHNQFQAIQEQRAVSPISPVYKKVEAVPYGILKQSQVKLMSRVQAPSNIYIRGAEDKPLKKSRADGHKKHGNTIKFLEEPIDSPRFADQPNMVVGNKSMVKSGGASSQIPALFSNVHPKMNLSAHGPNHVSFYPQNTERSIKLVTSNNFLTVQTQKSFRNEFLTHYCTCCYSQNDCCTGEHCCECWKQCCGKCGQGCCSRQNSCCQRFCDCDSQFWRRNHCNCRALAACLVCGSCACCCYQGKCCNSRCCEESVCLQNCSQTQCSCCDPCCRLRCCDCCYESAGRGGSCECCDKCCGTDCECLKKCLQGNCSFLETCCRDNCTCLRPCCTKKCECKCFDCPCCETGVCLWCRQNCCLICW